MAVVRNAVLMTFWCGTVLGAGGDNEKGDQANRRFSFGTNFPSSYVSYGGSPGYGSQAPMGNTGLGTSPVVGPGLNGSPPGAAGGPNLSPFRNLLPFGGGRNPGYPGVSTFSASLSIGGPGSGLRVATSPGNGLPGSAGDQIDLTSLQPYLYNDYNAGREVSPFSFYNKYKYEGPSRPYPVYIPKPFPVYVEKKVPIEVKVPVPQPFEVEKHVHVPLPVHVEKPYPVVVEKRVPVPVEKIIPLTLKEYVTKPYPIPIPVDKYVPVPYEKHVTYPYKHLPVPVERPYSGNEHYYPGVHQEGYYYPYYAQGSYPAPQPYSAPLDYLRSGEQRNYREGEVKKSSESDDREEKNGNEEDVEDEEEIDEEAKEDDERERTDVKRQTSISRVENVDEKPPRRAVNLLFSLFNVTDADGASEEQNTVPTDSIDDSEEELNSTTTTPSTTTTEEPNTEAETPEPYGTRIMRITTHRPSATEQSQP